MRGLLDLHHRATRETCQQVPSLKVWLLTGVVSALLMVATAWGATPDQMELTREAAIANAIRNNIDLRVEALNSAMDETRLARSRGIYDPILTSSLSRADTAFPGETYRTSRTFGSVGLTRYLPTGGSISVSTQTDNFKSVSDIPGSAVQDWQSAARLTISQPLLKNSGKDTMELSITLAANSLRGSLERFQFSLTDTVFAVITSYNRLFSLRHTLEERQSALSSAERFLKQIKRKPNPDAQQKVDVANAAYAIAQRRKEMVDAERSVSDQEAHLRFLIGIDNQARIIPVDPPSLHEPAESERQAIALALKSRADLKRLKLTLESSQLQEKVAHHQLLPDLSLTASGGFSGLASDFGDSFQQIGQGEGRWWSAGLQLRVPLGNTSAKNDYRQSQLRTEQVRQQITAFEWEVRDAVESDMRALISARLQRQTTQQSLHFAEQRLLEYSKQRKDGTATVQNVLDAENDLIAARNSQADASERFAYAVALLYRDMGVLLDRQHIHVDTAHPAAITRSHVVPAAEEELPTTLQSQPSFKAPVTTSTPPAPALSIPKKSTPRTAPQPQAAATPDSARPQEKIMTRLFCGSFTSARAALKKRDELRAAQSDPFILKGKTGDYRVFAASYAHRDSAKIEQHRLAALGVDSTLEDATIKLKTDA